MSTPTHTETTGDNQTDTKNATDPVPSRVSVTDLLKRETTLSFAGLTPADRHEYPAAVSSETQCHDAEPRALKDVISTLPEASSGELWATNEFVSVDGVVDTDAVRAVPGLDIEELEMATGQSLDEVIDTATADPLVQVRDHQDIVNERRKALCALGYDVKFRWQIASDRYSIINPQEAYLPNVGVASAGVMYFRVEVPGKSVHAAWGHEGVNAIGNAATVYRALEELDAERKARIDYEPAYRANPGLKGNVTNLNIGTIECLTTNHRKGPSNSPTPPLSLFPRSILTAASASRTSGRC
jgi:hypothetical protein